MAATNYTKPIGDYKLVRVRGRQAQILDPEVLCKILSILEAHEEAEGTESGRPLWDALYRSQPFHSTYVDKDGSYWRQENFGTSHPDYEIPKAFPWAVAQGLIPPAPKPAW
jgi:hypothetical protein